MKPLIFGVGRGRNIKGVRIVQAKFHKMECGAIARTGTRTPLLRRRR